MISIAKFYGGIWSGSVANVDWKEAPAKYRLPSDIGMSQELAAKGIAYPVCEVFVLRGVYDGEAEYGYSHDERQER